MGRTGGVVVNALAFWVQGSSYVGLRDAPVGEKRRLDRAVGMRRVGSDAISIAAVLLAMGFGTCGSGGVTGRVLCCSLPAGVLLISSPAGQAESLYFPRREVGFKDVQEFFPRWFVETPRDVEVAGNPDRSFSVFVSP